MTPAPERPGSAAAGGARFAALLRAHATATLTAAERAELARACREEPPRAAAVAGFAAVHAAFAGERALRDAVLPAAEPGEEADETYRRLAAAAARAEAELRSRLQHPAPPAVVVQHGRRGLRRAAAAVALLAAGVLVAAWLGAFAAAPPLQQGRPAPKTLGGETASIVIAPRLSAADRALSWGPLWHAAAYEVVIVDRGGNVVLQRSPEVARSTRWELSIAEFEQVRARGQELRLRVRALDGAGIPVGTSGDLPLTIE